MYLNTPVEFLLAASFLPNENSSDYDIENADDSLKITAKSSFLIFVKEVKSVPYQSKFGIMINQRFFDPKNKFIREEDGTSIER